MVRPIYQPIYGQFFPPDDAQSESKLSRWQLISKRPYKSVSAIANVQHNRLGKRLKHLASAASSGSLHSQISIVEYSHPVVCAHVLSCHSIFENQA